MNSSRRSFLDRYAALLLIVFALATPLLFYGAYRAVRSNTNKVVDWLPKSFVETGDLRWFREHFVGDQFVIISWDGCRMGDNPAKGGAAPDDPRIERLARLLVPTQPHASELDTSSDGTSDLDLRSERGREPSYGECFKSVTTGRRLLDRFTSPPMDVDYDLAVSRLKGSLIGSDGHQTCVVATLTDGAVNKFRDVLGRGHQGVLRLGHGEGVLFKALRACDIDTATVHLGGPPVDNVAIDEEGERTLVRLAGFAGLLGLTLAGWSLRSLKLTLIVFTCGLMSAAASLAAVWISGETTDAILLSMPALVYVLAISGAVHLINYYRDAVQEHGVRQAPERALAHGWKPALLCSVTTAMGLLSLCTSDLTPIRKFGIYSALGMMLMLIVLFVFLPAALQLWPIRQITTPVGSRTGRSHRRATNARKEKQTWSDAFRRMTSATSGGADLWHWFGGGIIRHNGSVTWICVVAIVGLALGVPRIRTSIDLMKLFGRDARILQDYQWLEANIGRLVPLEVVLRFDPNSLRRSHDTAADETRYSLLERMEVVADVQRAIDRRFGASGEDVVGPSISPVTFVPPLPRERRGTSSVVRRSATNSKLESSYESLLESGYLRIDKKDNAELWRISVRVAAFKDVDYGRMASELRSTVDPILTSNCRGGLGAGPQLVQADDAVKASRPVLSAVYTGVVPIVYKAQRALLQSLIESTLWSFITITPLLMFVSRGVFAGVVAMLPNVLPVLMVFGGMGWLKLPVDIGSMMSASIALGVAVDDTIHYLTWFREDLNQARDRRTAILVAYRRCATPTLQAAFINGLGLSVFAFSTFTPTRQFGLLMLTILLAGAVAELILLPALLAGPLGNAFQPRRSSTNHVQQPIIAPGHVEPPPTASKGYVVLRRRSDA